MRICHVITRLIVGGAQENTLLTCEGLYQRKYEVLLIAGPQTGPEGSLHERARRGGYELQVEPHLVRQISPYHDARALLALKRRFRRWQPEIVHTHSSKAGILARRAADAAGVPLVAHTVHGMSFNRTQPRWLQHFYRMLERGCARRSRLILCVAQAMRDQCLAAGIGTPQSLHVVYSGIETEQFDPAALDAEATRRSWGFPADSVVAITVARLFVNKGYEQLIPAMHQAAAKCPQIRFVWVGGGPHRDAYLRQLQRLGLRNKVHLTGLVSPAEIGSLLAGADMLVHASQWEGLPRAAVQALLVQRPVISFDIDGSPEVVLPRETGLLVPLNDVRELAQAMVMLAGDADLRAAMGRRGRQMCLERFDHRRMVEHIEALYEAAMSQRQGSAATKKLPDQDSVA
jgi:glycosyltransferase involved in cell wall biosynthesis